MSLTVGELEEGARRSRARSKENLLKKYHIARSLGFSSSEAVILMGRSRETMRSLAVQKGFLKDGEELPTPNPSKTTGA